MKKKNIFKYLTASFAFSILFSVVFLSNSTFAADNTFVRKAALTQIYNCYKTSGSLASPIPFSDYNDRNSLQPSDAETGRFPTGMTSLPTDDRLNTTPISCATALNGSGDFPGIYSLYNIPNPTNTGDDVGIVNQFMRNMGYSVETTSSGNCLEVSYNGSIYYGNGAAPSSVGNTIRVCANNVSDGRTYRDVIIKDDILSVTYGRTNADGSTDNLSYSDAVRVRASSGKITCEKIDVVPLIGTMYYKDVASVDFTSGSTTWGEFVDNVSRSGCFPESVSANSSSGISVGFQRGNYNPNAEDGQGTTYKITDRDNAARSALRYLSGGAYQSLDNLKLSGQEKRDLLQWYLDNYYHIEKRCGLSGDDAALASGDGYSLHTIIDGGAIKACYIRPGSENKDRKVQGWNESNDLLGQPGGMLTYDQVVQKLENLLGAYGNEQKGRCNTAANNARTRAEEIINSPNSDRLTGSTLQRAQDTIRSLDQVLAEHGEYWYEDDSGNIVCYPFTNLSGITTTTPTEGITDPGSTEDSPSDATMGSSLDACYASAGALGWVVCPVAQALSDFAEGIYSNFIEEYLSISPQFLSTSSGTYEGWKIFRDTANVLFAIILGVVILSQVTGIGVSNYGIKKILPTLIVTAVLVNLSYFLCQAAVDLSNIFGSQLKAFLESLPVSITNNGDGSIGLGGIAAGLAGVLAGGSLTIAGVQIAAATFSGWIFPVLLALLGAVIGMIAFFIILGLREAVVVVAVVISPLAIVLYALPNTKPLFTKWWKIFSTMLLVYPICGALMGGTSYASGLLLSVHGGFFMALIAVMMQVIPIFFIPGLVRSAFSMIGNLGTKISAFGQRFSRGTQGVIRNSEGYKDAQTRLTAGNLERRVKAFDEGRTFSTRTARGLRRLGFTEVADSVEAAGNRSRNRLNSRAKRSWNSVMDASVSGPAYGREQAEAYLATQQFKQNQAAIEDEKNRMINDEGYNHNDLSVLEQDYKRSLAAVDANPQDQAAVTHLEALTDMLGDIGPKGRDIVTTSVKDHIEGYNSGRKLAGGGAETALSRIAQNGSRADYKAGNYGFEKMIGDYLSSDPNSLQSRSYYETIGAGNLSASAITKLDDSSYKDMISRIRGGAFHGREGELQKIMDSATQALSDPRISSNLKPEVQNWLNQIRSSGYIHQRKEYINKQMNIQKQRAIQNGQTLTTQDLAAYRQTFKNDFVTKNGRFHAIRPSQTIPIPHNNP